MSLLLFGVHFFMPSGVKGASCLLEYDPSLPRGVCGRIGILGPLKGVKDQFRI